MKTKLSKSRALSTVLTTVIILVASVVLGSGVVLYGASLFQGGTQTESISASGVKVWVHGTDDTGLAWGAAKIRNTGDKVVSIDKIQIRGADVPFSQWYTDTVVSTTDAAIIDCTIELGPALEATRQTRERRAAEAKTAAEAKAAEYARVTEESRATAALKAAAEARAATKDSAKPSPAASPAPVTSPSPAATAASPATNGRPGRAGRAPEPVQHEARFLGRALGREVERDVDGLFSDAAWLGADRFSFEVRGASGKIPVAAWALWSPERLWVMLRWPDRSKDAAHRSWIWSKDIKSLKSAKLL